jgi:hypothetical protein
LAKGQRLSTAQRNGLRNWRREAFRNGNRGLGRFLGRYGRYNWWRGWNRGWGLGLIGLVGGGGYFLDPGDPGEDGGGDGGDLIDPDGNAFPCPPGIDPGGGAACFPEDPGEPTGPCIVTALEPESIEPGWGQGDDDDVPVPEDEDEEEDAEAIDAVWQTTRYVRLTNGYNSRVTVDLTYETVDGSDHVVQDTCQVVLDPGEVVDVMQGDWQVNAQRVEFTARADDGKEWKRFSKQWLNLVPEKDEQGVPGYASPSIQTSVIAIR